MEARWWDSSPRSIYQVRDGMRRLATELAQKLRAERARSPEKVPFVIGGSAGSKAGTRRRGSSLCGVERTEVVPRS